MVKMGWNIYELEICSMHEIHDAESGRIQGPPSASVTHEGTQLGPDDADISSDMPEYFWMVDICSCHCLGGKWAELGEVLVSPIMSRPGCLLGSLLGLRVPGMFLVKDVATNTLVPSAYVRPVLHSGTYLEWKHGNEWNRGKVPDQSGFAVDLSLKHMWVVTWLPCPGGRLFHGEGLIYSAAVFMSV